MSVDNAKEIDVTMPIYNLIEYMNIYLKTSRSLWQYYRDEPALDNVTILLIFLLTMIIVFRSNLKKK